MDSVPAAMGAPALPGELIPLNFANSFLGVGYHHLHDDSDSEDDECLALKVNPEQRPVVGITSIPNELLAIIFELAHEVGGCPFTISTVSRHWREVALNIPCLWVKIVINSTPSLVALSACLSRSKSSSLDVCFDGLSVDAPQSSFNQAMDLVFPHITRWRRLEVILLPPTLVQGYFLDMPIFILLSRLKGCSAPLLEHLSISGARSHVRALEAFAVDGAPMLTSMHLKDISFGNLFVPMASVTTLHLHEFRHRYDRLLSILEASPLLTRLSLQGSVLQPFLPRSISLPSLKSLRYRFPTPVTDGGVSVHFTNCLPSISAPGLETLWLVDPTDADMNFLLKAINFSADSTKLRSLILQNATFSQATYDKIFAAIPRITHFTMIQERTLEIWELLCQSSVQNPWPELCSVTLAIPWLDLIIPGPESDEALLCGLLSARIAAGHPITKLRIEKRSLQNCELDRLPKLVTLEAVETLEPWPSWSDWVTAID